MGGAATNSGINYQQRIAALVLASQYSQFDLLSTFGIAKELKILSVHFETEEPIDDLTIKCENGHNVYLQIKRSLSLELASESDFFKTIKQFVTQYIKDSEHTQNYVLVTSPQSSRPITQELTKVCESIRLNPNSFRDNPINRSEAETLEKFELLFNQIFHSANGRNPYQEEFIEFAEKVYVCIVDIEQGRPNEQVALILLKSMGLIDAVLVWNSLIANSLEYARKRQSINHKALSEILDRYLIKAKPEKVDKYAELAEYLTTEFITTGDLPVGKEVLFIESFIEDADFLIAELFRFDDGGKIKHDFHDKKVKLFGTNEEWKIIYRAATMQGMERYLAENGKRFKGKHITIIPANEIEEVESTPSAILHRKYLMSLNDQNTDKLRCLHCDKPLNPSKSVLVEIDDVNSKPAAGAVHPKCLRVIDRVMGITDTKGKKLREEYLQEFDYKEWAFLLMKGQAMMEQYKSAQIEKGQQIKIFWSSENKDTRQYSYCLKNVLADGSSKYLTDRGRIHRFSKSEAEFEKGNMTRKMKTMTLEGDPMGYTSQNMVYGRKSQLMDLKDADEGFIDVVKVEVDKYSKLLEKQDEQKNFYTPICLVRGKENEIILAFGSSIPLISDPLEFGKIYETWKHIGHQLPIDELELLIIKSDSEFDMYMRDFFSDSMKPFVDPVFNKNGQLISGLEIQHMQLEFAIKSEESRIKIPNPKWKKGERVKVLHPTIQDNNYPIAVVQEDEFRAEDGELYVLLKAVEVAAEYLDITLAVPSKLIAQDN